MSGYHYYEERPGFGFGRVTWAVQRIILFTVAVFCVQLVLNIFLGGRGQILGGYHVEHWLALNPRMVPRGAVWQVLTYQFLHADLMHLFMNMIGLYFLGPEVERRLGTPRFYRFYLLCGVAGALLTILVDLLPHKGPSAIVLGASGATLGVVVAFATLDPDRQLVLFPIPIPISARAMVILIIVLNIIASLDGSPIAVTAHFGGMAAGYVLIKLQGKTAQWFKRPKKPKKRRHPDDKVGEAVDNIFKFKDRH